MRGAHDMRHPDYDLGPHEPAAQGPPHLGCDRPRSRRSLAACGTEKIIGAEVGPAAPPRARSCSRSAASGCHTLSYAATHGSAVERAHRARSPTGRTSTSAASARSTRVLYAIENGGFSGAIMPQNVVVGQDARDVAQFVAKYAGRQAPKTPGVPPCDRSRSARCRRPRPPRALRPRPASTTTSSLVVDQRRRQLGQEEEVEPRRRAAVLDIRLIRRDPDAVRAALARRGPDAAAAVDRVLELDERWRALTAELEELRAEQNRASRGRKGPPTPEEREQLAALAARGRELSDEETAVRAELDARAGRRSRTCPRPTRPTRTRSCARSARPARPAATTSSWPARGSTSSAAARLSGSRFAYLRGDLVMLELALVRYALEKLRAEGFEPVIPPVLVREQALYGTGILPDTEQQIYRLRRRRSVPGRHLGGGAGLAAPRRDPRRRRAARAATPASRPASAARRAPPARTRAASSACTSSTRSRCSASSSPTRAPSEHERLLAIEESILQELEIPYRVVAIAVDDLGASAAKKYDCEAWLPGPGPLPRADLVLEHDRLPGPAARHPLPARRRQAGPRAHAERDRGRGRPDDHRAARERAARGRLGGAAGGARALRRAGDAAGGRLTEPSAAGRDAGPGGGAASSTTSAARGGPQAAIRARIRTPKVFHGRTNA